MRQETCATSRPAPAPRTRPAPGWSTSCASPTTGFTEARRRHRRRPPPNSGAVPDSPTRTARPGSPRRPPGQAPDRPLPGGRPGRTSTPSTSPDGTASKTNSTNCWTGPISRPPTAVTSKPTSPTSGPNGGVWRRPPPGRTPSAPPRPDSTAEQLYRDLAARHGAYIDNFFDPDRPARMDFEGWDRLARGGRPAPRHARPLCRRVTRGPRRHLPSVPTTSTSRSGSPRPNPTNHGAGKGRGDAYGAFNRLFADHAASAERKGLHPYAAPEWKDLADKARTLLADAPPDNGSSGTISASCSTTPKSGTRPGPRPPRRARRTRRAAFPSEPVPLSSPSRLRAPLLRL